MQLTKMGNKGQAAVIGVLLVVIISLMIGLYVYSAVGNSIDRSDFSAAQNTTYDSVVSNSNSAFTLTSILPLVIGAAAILGVIVGGAFLRGRA